MSLSARFPYLIQSFKCVHIKRNQHRTRGLPAGLRKQNGGVLVVHRMHPVSLTDIFTSSFPFGAQMVKVRIPSQTMREKKPLLHSSPILRWDLTRRGRWGLRRDLPSRPAEAGWGMWDAARGTRRLQMRTGDARLRLPVRPSPRPTPDPRRLSARPRWARGQGLCWVEGPPWEGALAGSPRTPPPPWGLPPHTCVRPGRLGATASGANLRGKTETQNREGGDLPENWRPKL